MTDIETRIRLLEEDMEVIREWIEGNTGFYGFAKQWLKYYPTDLSHFFPEEVNYISNYFEKMLKKKLMKDDKK